jgi:hypothetical protein
MLVGLLPEDGSPIKIQNWLQYPSLALNLSTLFGSTNAATTLAYLRPRALK